MSLKNPGPDFSAVEQLTAEQRRRLEACLRLETIAAETYFALADAHGNDPEISALWRKTAGEEINHAEQFKLALRLREGLVREMRAEEPDVQEALELARAFLERVRTDPPGIVEALKTAVQLEVRFADLHADEAVGFRKGSQRRLFRAMREADDDHVQRLRAALHKREPGRASVVPNA
jgi:rubrerythrin